MSMRRSCRGLTLMETIVSIALIVTLLSAALTFYLEVVQVRDTTAVLSERTLLAKQVLSRMETELRGCVGMSHGFPVEQRLAGDRRSITFMTTALPSDLQYQSFRESEKDALPPGQHDLRVLGYRLWVDPENQDENGQPIVGGIVRTEKRTLNQFIVEEDDPLQLREDLWAHEFGYLEFRYYDGFEWDTVWDVTQGNSLPHAVMVTLGFKPLSTDELENRDLDQFPIADYPFGDEQEHPDRYSLVIRLPAADQGFGAHVRRAANSARDAMGVEGGPK